jgi:hypothetical protein
VLKALERFPPLVAVGAACWAWIAGDVRLPTRRSSTGSIGGHNSAAPIAGAVVVVRRQMRFLLPVDGSPRLLAAVRRDSTPRKEISPWRRPGNCWTMPASLYQSHAAIGDPAAVIVAYAERKGCAEIIMGTCGPRSRRRGCCSARLCEAR